MMTMIEILIIVILSNLDYYYNVMLNHLCLHSPPPPLPPKKMKGLL